MAPTIINDKFLLDFIKQYASIGTWEFDLNSASLNWSSEIKKIHEVPKDYEPNLESAINFYKKGYSRDTITKQFSNCIENQTKFDTELQIITAKGKDLWVRAIGIPIIENGIFLKIQGIFQDINEKTKISKKLIIREEVLRQTFEYALVGMAILDLQGNWINVNKSLCKILGYSELELKKLTFSDISHPEDSTIGHSTIIDMLNGKVDNFETEKRYVRKNREVIWTRLSISIVKKDNGEPLHFVVQISNISQIKESNKKVKKLLDTTNKQNKRLLNFAHIVSHNLRSHYSNLDMLLDIIRMDLPEATKNEIFPMIEEAVSQLGETVENLNEVAAINIKGDIKLERINLLDSLNKVTGSISGIIMESNTTLCVGITPDINIFGVPAYLESIILNFLTNAIKYRKRNESAKIELDAFTRQNYIILRIKDYGLGIDLEKYGDKLFGMYKTFHKHKDSRGLGLFITKNQIEAIGGKVEVDSEINVGTAFYIHFKKYE